MSCENTVSAEEAAKSYCEPGTDTNKMGKNAVVLSSKRFDRVMNSANNLEYQRIHKDAEEKRKYQEYLKKGNEELVAKFTGKVQRTEMDKVRQLNELNELKLQQIKKSYEEAKENEEKQRRERIAYAQELVDKLKPGPRQLRSAAIESEIYHGRDIQIDMSKEYQKCIKKQECVDKKRCEGQAAAFVNEEQTRMEERKKNAISYKNDLLKTIGEHAKQRAEAKERALREERNERLVVDSEIKSQIERERAIMEKKRAALRKNALEAMKMVEQRRLRERMIDEVENRLCCVYNTGKRELDKKRAEQTKHLQEQRIQKMADVAKILESKMDSKENEDERLRRDISTMQLKFTAEEQEKVNRDKAAKKARIEAFCREQEAAKLAKQRNEEEKRFEMANRFKNSDVNCQFKETQKQERLRRIKENRCELEKQMKEKQLAQQAEREMERACVTHGYENDDRFFFQYANNLMTHAKQKQRPLYPFIKVVQNYNREHNILCNQKVPKHLVSQVPIDMNGSARGSEYHKGGYLKKRNSATSNRFAQQQQPLSNYSPATQKSIQENCRKIDNLLKESLAQPNQTCEAQNPIDCYKQGSSAALTKADSCEDKIEPPSKLRYSMTELRSLNQFACE